MPANERRGRFIVPTADLSASIVADYPPAIHTLAPSETYVSIVPIVSNYECTHNENRAPSRDKCLNCLIGPAIAGTTSFILIHYPTLSEKYLTRWIEVASDRLPCVRNGEHASIPALLATSVLHAKE